MNMQTSHDHRPTPQERLEHVAKASKPFHHELWGPNYLIAVGLLLLILILVGLGIVSGILSSELMREHAQQIFNSSRR
jgi:hypothetical protein